MTYVALARKWRPKKFENVVGQQHVLSAMINSLDNQSLHHAYLFSGTRGVGKTSLARLFAKSINCEQGISSKPCGVCSACVEVDQGNYIDLLEIDAASRTKVEDTRELLDNVQYRPARGRFKIYLIDEVHMLSRHSFNALLKTLEEPPEHVKFLLATTDPQKLPVTVLSRCLQFQLKALSVEQIQQHLVHMAQVDAIAAEERAFELLAKAADGSLRDAQSLMDQALALGGGRLVYASVLDMLGHLDPHQVKQLLCYVVAGEVERAFAKIAELVLLAPDYVRLHQQLAELLHQVALAQVLPSSSGDETINMLAQRCDAQLIQLLYQITVTGQRDLEFAPSPRSGFEMTVLRMLAFEPAPVVTQLPQVTAEAIDDQDTLGSSLNSEQDEILAQAQQMMDVPAEVVVTEPSETVLQGLPAIDIPDATSPEDYGYSEDHASDQADLQEYQSVPEQTAPSPVSSPTQDLLKVRSLLRSQTRGQNSPKKPVDRVPTKAPVQTSVPEWQAQPVVPCAPVAPVTPTVKPVSEGETISEHHPWGDIVEQLTIGPLTKQVALNALFNQDETRCSLLVKSEFAHLINDSTIEELRLGLCQRFGYAISLDVGVGEKSQQVTPMEHRQLLHQQRLAEAKKRLLDIDSVQFMIERLDAELIDESVKYY